MLLLGPWKGKEKLSAETAVADMMRLIACLPQGQPEWLGVSLALAAAEPPKSQVLPIQIRKDSLQSSHLWYSSQLLQPGFVEMAASCHASSHMHLSPEDRGVFVKPLLIIYQAH